MNFLSSRSCCGCCQSNWTRQKICIWKKSKYKCTASPAAGGWSMGGRTAWTSPAGCHPSCWSCASCRCFSSPGRGCHSPPLLGAPQENILLVVAEASLAIASEGVSCDWLWCKQMKSFFLYSGKHKTPKNDLDSAMASKWKKWPKNWIKRLCFLPQEKRDLIEGQSPPQ